MRRVCRNAALFLFLVSLAVRVEAGPIFLTGHDPDFHAQGSIGAQNLLRIGLNFAMGGLLNNNVNKFLWVESFIPATSGHLVGANGLTAIGLTQGQDYDWVDAAGFAIANLANYTAIGVASTFGGMLTSNELNALIARSAAIQTFINNGGGLFASSECENVSNCDQSNLLIPHGPLFGYLPVTVSSVNTTGPYTPTAYGTSLGLTVGDLNDATHNSFGAVGGLNVVDVGAGGIPTTLAGVVTVGGGGFTPVVPEPGTMSLLGLGLLAAARKFRKRR
jgi:PEP-CTERM motif-containing protein